MHTGNDIYALGSYVMSITQTQITISYTMYRTVYVSGGHTYNPNTRYTIEFIL